MKKIILFFSLSFFVQNFALGNAAQPGMWQAGGMGNYALMFPEDSLAFRKIQMVDERVSILLYNGFAVVKGEYWMYNDTDKNITIKTGYPINGFAEGKNSKLVAAIFDELHGLKVLVNEKETPLIKKEKIDNWYIWNNTFTKKSTTKIEVYFLMNTNQARVRKGYSIDYSNGFVYLLETGAAWKQPIIKGEIRLQTKGNMKLENLSGIYPSNFFEKNEIQHILRGQFKNLTPTEKNNIVIKYGKQIENFDFNKIVNQREVYFKEVNHFGKMDLMNFDFEIANFNSPFEVANFKRNKLGIPQPTSFIGWFQIAFWGIIALLTLLISFFIYRRIRR